MTMQTTEWKNYKGLRDTFRIRARYGFDVDFARRNNQAPYFSVTGETEIWERGRWRENTCGAIHEEIAKRFPRLAGLIRWHLVSTVEPLHYMANALFWYDEGQRLGWDTLDSVRYMRTTSLENLKKTIVYGCIATDAHVDLRTMSRDNLAEWLQLRKPFMMAQFVLDMAEAGIEYPR